MPGSGRKLEYRDLRAWRLSVWVLCEQLVDCVARFGPHDREPGDVSLASQWGAEIDERWAGLSGPRLAMLPCLPVLARGSRWPSAHALMPMSDRERGISTRLLQSDTNANSPEDVGQ